MTVTTSTPGNAREHWVQIAVGMKEDLAAYQQLQQLLHAQFHAALRHDANDMTAIAGKISAKAELLELARLRRVGHVRALLPAGAAASMTAVFALLKSPLKEQLADLWTQLQQQVQSCKAMNVRNCGLIMEQAQTMRHVLQGPSAADDIYGPR